MNTRTCRILLVDDHTVVRQGLKQMIEDEIHPVVFGEAANAAEALALIQHEDWSMVLLDITMPGRSGLELLADIRAQKPALPVLVLSMYSEEQYAVRVIQAGAVGYLTKGCPSSELIAAVRRVLETGQFYAEPGANQMASVLQRSPVTRPHEQLSDREMEVLRLLGSGKTPTEIGSILSLSVKSISTYRARILEKTGLRNSAELIHYAIRNGLTD